MNLSTIEIIIIGIGTVFAAAGIILFARMGSSGENTLKLLGFEFKLTGSALVIFVLGCVLILVPITKSKKSDTDIANTPSVAREISSRERAKRVSFAADNLQEPFAIKARFKGNVAVSSSQIQVHIEDGELSFPKAPPAGPRTYLKSVRVGLVKNVNASWSIISHSSSRSLEKLFEVGQTEQLVKVDFIVPIPEGVNLADCWLVFEIITKRSSDDPTEGMSYAHTTRSLF